VPVKTRELLVVFERGNNPLDRLLSDPGIAASVRYANTVVENILYPACRLVPWEQVQTGDTVWREFTQEFRTITRIAPLAERSRYMYFFPDGSDTERSFQVFDREIAVVMEKET
jgi:hypothetical protein